MNNGMNDKNLSPFAKCYHTNITKYLRGTIFWKKLTTTTRQQHLQHDDNNNNNMKITTTKGQQH